MKRRVYRIGIGGQHLEDRFVLDAGGAILEFGDFLAAFMHAETLLALEPGQRHTVEQFQEGWFTGGLAMTHPLERTVLP